MLIKYQQITRRLLSDPTFARLNDFDLRDWINIARAQVAIDGECVRANGGFSVPAPGVQSFQLSAVTPSGTSTPLVVRNAFLNNVQVDIRSWDWFAAFYFTRYPPGTRAVMAQQGQGTTSTLWLAAPAAGEFVADLVLLPADLVDDTTAEVLPYPFTDAVPFYAAWYAAMSENRANDAQAFSNRYLTVIHRARAGSTSTNLPENNPGGSGAAIATTKMTLGAPPPQMPQSVPTQMALAG